MTPPAWAGEWRWEVVQGSAAALHARSAARIGGPAAAARSVWVLQPSGPAVALGSAQPECHIDAAAADAAAVEVVRRPSGGGAVLLGPGRCLWVDLVIGRGDPLWDDDIGRAAWWVGEAWAAAVGAIGQGRAVAWKGALVRTPWSGRACFGGLGPGEVTVEGSKVVGIAQRRTRAGVLFQCAALLGPQPPGPAAVWEAGTTPPPGEADGLAELAALQSLGEAERAAMYAELRRTTFPLPPAAAAPLAEALRSLLGPS